MEDPPGFRLELHNGEVVKVTRPKYKHALIQMRITELFNSLLKGQGRALPEFAFRPYPQHELRVADVGWIPRGREEQIDREDNLQGAPDIVVEVLSPSNTIPEMLKKKALCFNTGCVEFWLVDPVEQLVEIIPVNGAGHLYRKGELIPIGQKTCLVDDIFSEAD